MKIQRLMTRAAIGLLVLAGLSLVACQQAASTDSTTNYSGTAHYYYPVHQSGVVADAKVTSDVNGNVISASIDEWQSPNSWVTQTGSYPNTKTGSPGNTTDFAGGEVFRMKFFGANSSSSDTQIKDYAFFYALVTLVTGDTANNPKITTSWSLFTPGATAPVSASLSPNLDLKLASPLYAKAYADACAADNATDLVNVTVSYAATPVITVGAKASSTVRTGAMNKAAVASTYFPITAASLGYKANLAALIKYFTANPTADYTKAVAKTYTWPQTFVAPSATYTATSDAVWTITTNGVDSVSGATYSDFPNYALGLQNAYLYALAESKSGDHLRAVK